MLKFTSRSCPVPVCYTPASHPPEAPMRLIGLGDKSILPVVLLVTLEAKER